MIITCKACGTSFSLDDKMLKPTGTKVRCSVCANIFAVFPEALPETGVQDEPAEPDTAPQTTQAGLDQSDTASRTATAETSTNEIDDAVSRALEEDAFDDFDLDIDDGDDADDSEATMIADLDDIDAGGLSDSDETAIVDLDEDDLDLDIPIDTDDDDDGDESVTMVVADLDEDGSLDLDDDDLSLPFEEDSSPEQSPGETEDALEDDLDLSLDLDFDDDVPAAEPPVVEATESKEDDLVLELEEDEGFSDEKPDPPAPEMILEDDLDLSGLEEMFDEQDDDTKTLVVDGDDLALDIDEPAVADGAGETKAADEALPELELELDEDDGAGGADDATDELDLSEIEKMLEEPQAGGQKISVPEQDLELDVEASLESEKWMESGKDQLVGDEEFDLSELEQALEDVDTGSDEAPEEDQELELDLSEDDDPAKATETVVLDSDLDFDLSDFDEQTAGQTDTGAGADMELEFEVEESPAANQPAAEEYLDETVVMTHAGQEEIGVEETTAEPAFTAAAAPGARPDSPRKEKKKSKKSLVFILILLILGGAGYGILTYLSKSGIEIPFISEYLNPKPKDLAGIEKLIINENDINSRFVENSSVGRLFVITGKVKNGYDDNRGMVSIMGKIFSSNKRLIHQEKVYCGNIMSDLELANLEWDKIAARLANRLGDNRSNVKIRSGRSIPFMVVFADLPADLGEYKIEAIGSISLK